MADKMTHLAPGGFRFAGVACGLKKNPTADFAAIVSDLPCVAAATFTQNQFPAAPVLYDRALVSENPLEMRAIIVNAGIANACTGDTGLVDANAMAQAAEAAFGLPSRSCAVMSTGVIGPRLPMDKIRRGVQAAAGALRADGWDAASKAIMTTDTRPKVASRQVGDACILGMAKGAGMIHPNMATMLVVIVTDAAIPAGHAGQAEELAQALRAAVHVSFNAISVDGDTSTNDTVMLLANGAGGLVNWPEFNAALTDLCVDLAHQVVRDGEGATKFITIQVSGASSEGEARQAAKAIANSPLVKTAFYGGDANWGRILCAVGYSGATVVPALSNLWIVSGRGDAGGYALQLVQGGQPLTYSEAIASDIFAGPDITVKVDLGLGSGAATVWTCDLSHEYVNINGHYRT